MQASGLFCVRFVKSMRQWLAARMRVDMGCQIAVPDVCGRVNCFLVTAACVQRVVKIVRTTLMRNPLVRLFDNVSYVFHMYIAAIL